MTIQQLRREIQTIKKGLDPGSSRGRVIIYDPLVGPPDSKTLPPASYYIFLPEKDPIPE